MSEITAIRPVERAVSSLPVEPVAAPAPRNASPRDHAKAAEQPLEPAVTVDLGESARAAERASLDYRTQFIRDQDTRQMVYQVVDPGSGDVVVQLPTATVLKARAYAEATAARAAPVKGEVKQPVDRIA